jgi:hypothetical protein
MALGERGLDGALTFVQPIQRGVEFNLIDIAQAEFDAETRSRGGRIERLDGRQLGRRSDDPADDHRQNQIARPVGLAVVPRPEQTVEADRAGPTQRGRDVAVRQRAPNRQGLLTGGNENAAFQDAAQSLDMLGRPVRQIEQRALAQALPSR